MKKAEIIAKYGEEAYQRILERQRQYYQDNKEEVLERQRQWREDNPEYQKQYKQTQYGRAVCMCNNYQQADKKQNRGDCTLTPDYIVDHIFPNGCLYCGERDWTKLGCDRVDNDLPHTPDNVVCCCKRCNDQRQKKGFDIFLYKSWKKRFA